MLEINITEGTRSRRQRKEAATSQGGWRERYPWGRPPGGAFSPTAPSPADTWISPSGLQSWERMCFCSRRFVAICVKNPPAICGCLRRPVRVPASETCEDANPLVQIWAGALPCAVRSGVSGPDLHASNFLTLTFLGGAPDFLILTAWNLGTKCQTPIHPGVQKGLFRFSWRQAWDVPSLGLLFQLVGYTVAVFLLKLYLSAVRGKSPVDKRDLFQEHVCKTNVFVSPTKFPRYPTNAINYAVLSCERLIILVTQTVHENQTQKLENTLQHTAQGLEEYGGPELQLARGLASSRQARGAPDCGGGGRAEGSWRRRAGCDVTRAWRRQNAVGISKVGLLKICV